MIYSFPHYLSAKKSVDDRAINRLVWEALQEALIGSALHIGSEKPVRILEIGAGIGTMLERMLEWGLIGDLGPQAVHYSGIDAQAENIAEALVRLPAWAQAELKGQKKAKDAGLRFQVERIGPGQLKIDRQQGRHDQATASNASVTAEFEAIDLFDFIIRDGGSRHWDLLVGHAFLDLLDLPASLPQIFSLLEPGGLFYFSINFDGLTIFEPPVDPEFDDQVLALYHRSMDERRSPAGSSSGDSRTGRRLFTHLEQAGAEIISAGPSDWVVFPRQHTYAADEAYFLYFILHFFDETLREHPELDPQRFQDWLEARRSQIERGELVYIAHQLDFLGRYSGRSG